MAATLTPRSSDEAALAALRLRDAGMNSEQIARLLGKSSGHWRRALSRIERDYEASSNPRETPATPSSPGAAPSPSPLDASAGRVSLADQRDRT